MPTHTVELGKDLGGNRYFLDGKPLHCGTPVQVFFPDEGQWINGRFELYQTRIPSVVINGVGQVLLDDRGLSVTVRRLLS